VLLSQIKVALDRKGGEHGEPGYFAPGLPSRELKRVIPSVNKPEEWEFSEQIHDADRAGRHSDLRLSDGRTAFSWALRKGLPSEPGEKRLAIRQPDHAPSYLPFSGRIESRYGHGTVDVNRIGPVRVLSASPSKVRIVALDRKNPQEITMVKTPGQGKDKWLAIDTTPTVKSRPDIVLGKEKFRLSSANDLGRFLSGKFIMAPKIDGGAVTVNLGDRVEIFSHAPSTSGELVNHSYVLPTGEVPKDLKGTQIKAEILGRQGGKVIPLRTLGGILNSTPENALDRMTKEKIKLFLAPWKMVKFRGKRVDDLPYEDQLDLMKEVTKKVDAPWIRIPQASTPTSKIKLIEAMKSGKHPLTDEGLVAWPKGAISPIPTKVPFNAHSQVYIVDVYPMVSGGKKMAMAGGFSYSLKPGGPVVGNVGTGFTMQERKEFWRDREALKGAKIVIESKGQFPSGAHRAPSYKSLHL